MEKQKTRINRILETLNNGLHEREEVMSVALLAALSDQNIFLLGPPGTAKSLISRRLSHAFKTDSYFEYLMQKFSTPEEIFGPISIAELKKDNYTRKTEQFLPTSDFAFLDEIWKSGPAILNTLLTVINEKKFKNGHTLENVPLKVLISASNETPPKGQGLEALYDRFLVRLYVPPMKDKNNFEGLLQVGGTDEKVDLKQDVITHDEWESWKLDIGKVKLSVETFNVINAIRQSLVKDKKLKVYVSDRRWQKAAHLLKASAFFCDRIETNLADTLLLRHCLWTTEDNREQVIKIVEDSVRESGFDTKFSSKKLDEQKDALEKEITDELFYSEDIYKTTVLNDKQYFKCTQKYNTHSDYYYYLKRGRDKDGLDSQYKDWEEKIIFYISQDKIKSATEFYPVDNSGNEIKEVKCNFGNQGACHVEIFTQEGWRKTDDFSPVILAYKDSKKDNVNNKLIKALEDAVKSLSKDIKDATIQIKKQSTVFKEELDTPFIPKKIRDIALAGVIKQIKDMELRSKDCERLMELTKV